MRRKVLKKKWITALALVTALALTSACSAQSEPEVAASEAASAEANSSAQGSDAPKPELGEVPDIVAIVNGEKITKEDFTRIYEGQFQQIAQQAQMSGQGIDQAQLRKQTAEGLVNTELLIQQAAKKKIFATSKDLDQALADVAKSNKLDTRAFLETMAKQGLDENAVRAQLRTQLEVERLIAKEVGDFTPDDKDLKAAYEIVKKQAAADPATAKNIPSFDEIKSELSQQLKLQKEASAVKSYVEKLRKDAKIEMKF